MIHNIHTSGDKLAYCGVATRRDMTNEEKCRLVNSVYSNPKKLTIAQLILSHKSCTSEQIIEATKFHKVSVSQMISEMIQVGVVEMAQSAIDKRVYYLTMTDLGKRLLKL